MQPGAAVPAAAGKNGAAVPHPGAGGGTFPGRVSGRYRSDWGKSIIFDEKSMKSDCPPGASLAKTLMFQDFVDNGTCVEYNNNSVRDYSGVSGETAERGCAQNKAKDDCHGFR